VTSASPRERRHGQCSSTGQPYRDEAAIREDELERSRNAGFYCLRVEPVRLEPGKDMFTYEVDATGTRFTLRAFRSYLYDPDGTLPRFERRGMIDSRGKLVIDRRLYRVAPGGRVFNGHPGEGRY
jgi:hypothetical protein